MYLILEKKLHAIPNHKFKFEIICAGGTSYKFGKLPRAGPSERKQSK
jgi:hypothetical protein